MKIYLVRHAQSQWQVRPSEDWDTPLSALGHEQAEKLGQWLAQYPPLYNGERLEVGTLCASPMVRAQETAQYPAAALQIPILTDDGLREADFHVSAYLQRSDNPLQVPSLEEPAELYASFKVRAQEALASLVSRAESNHGPVLAIAHGGLIKTLLRVVVKSDLISFRLYNTGVSMIEWEDGRWHVVYLNLLDHLPPKLRTI